MNYTSDQHRLIIDNMPSGLAYGDFIQKSHDT